MKSSITTLLVLLTLNVFSQEFSDEISDTLGYRLPPGKVVRIYETMNSGSSALDIDFDNWRWMNSRVYFQVFDDRKTINDVEYVLIAIPGRRKILQQDHEEINVFNNPENPLNGLELSEYDLGGSFWVKASDVNNPKVEHYPYANAPFSGILTAPFKYRLAVGEHSNESFMDGSFNVAPFLGWKFRISRSESYYLAPFGFAGVTTLNYSSANNSGITDPNQSESGAGLTYGGGIAFRFNDINPGIIIGYDHGFGDLGSTFQFNDKIWISFSLAYDFFSPAKDKESSPNNTL